MITIREMQIDDLEQVMPIEEANFSIPWTETGFFTFLIRDDALFLVAEEDGEILGYLGILISFDESEITNVCVAEKARRRGIGRALMEELAVSASSRSFKIVSDRGRKVTDDSFFSEEKRMIFFRISFWRETDTMRLLICIQSARSRMEVY